MIIKVNRARLIAAIQAKRKKAVEEHYAKAKAAAREFKEYREGVQVALLKFSAVVRSATQTEDITAHLKYGETLRLPEAPDKPKQYANTAELDAALTKLSLSDEETIQLNEKSDRTFLDLLG